MIREFRFDHEVERNLSDATVKTLKVFPQMLDNLERLLRSYHKDNPAGLVERSPLPLENFNASGRQIATMFLTKAIYYSRAIIDNVNSRNLLVAFQSMRALVEVVAAVRYTLEKLEPLIHEFSSRGVVTAEQARGFAFVFSSSSVFHSPQPEHRPVQRGAVVPHSRQT